MVRTEDIDELIAGFKRKEKRALARLISLVENDPELASSIFKHFEKPTNSYVIGFTGAPGVGKSTLINQVVKKLVEQGKTVGIISVDPSSPFSGGAFLGDRIRMSDLQNENIFMRSMASRGAVGGLSRASSDICLLFEAFGIDIIIVETVGAGQSEVDVLNLADTVIVINVPGLGDSIQCQKAGIIEIADILVVNKKDLGGEEIAVQLDLMLDDAVMFIGQSGWRPPVVQTNSISGEGIDELVEEIWNHKEHIELSGALAEKRKKRMKDKLTSLIQLKIEHYVINHIYPKIEDSVLNQLNEKKYRVYDIADEISNNFLSPLKKSEGS
ncbi:MAG TPA: methylmalonyl Co-A mutase-associated GTPase MeaB [Candidatus Deferrimicrobium sp.]|nr:methylmalonyl Co-A mutase-associated GTPase MeaB [Candidatus Deferrimicrobium sp.]